MKGFINNLINRHTKTDSHVKPRSRARYEPPASSLPSAFLPVSQDNEIISPKHDDKIITGNQGDLKKDFFRHNTHPAVFPSQDQLLRGNNEAHADQSGNNTASFSLKDKPSEIQNGSSTVANNNNNDTGFLNNSVHPTNAENRRDDSSANEGANSIKHGVDKEPAVLINQDKEYPDREIAAFNKDDFHAEDEEAFKGILPNDKLGLPVKLQSITRGFPGEAAWLNEMNKRELFGQDNNSGAVKSETPGLVKVTIGKIEVRAIHQAPPQVKSAPPFKPMMSLDDYLNKRNKGER